MDALVIVQVIAANGVIIEESEPMNPLEALALMSRMSYDADYANCKVCLK